MFLFEKELRKFADAVSGKTRGEQVLALNKLFQQIGKKKEVRVSDLGSTNYLVFAQLNIHEKLPLLEIDDRARRWVERNTYNMLSHKYTRNHTDDSKLYPTLISVDNFDVFSTHGMGYSTFYENIFYDMFKLNKLYGEGKTSLLGKYPNSEAFFYTRHKTKNYNDTNGHLDKESTTIYDILSDFDRSVKDTILIADTLGGVKDNVAPAGTNKSGTALYYIVLGFKSY